MKTKMKKNKIRTSMDKSPIFTWRTRIGKIKKWCRKRWRKNVLSFLPLLSYLKDLIIITGELELLCTCIEHQQQGYFHSLTLSHAKDHTKPLPLTHGPTYGSFQKSKRVLPSFLPHRWDTISKFPEWRDRKKILNILNQNNLNSYFTL